MPAQKTLFLTSSIIDTLPDIVNHLGRPAKGMSLAFISTASEMEGGMRSWIYDDLSFFHNLGFYAFQYTLTDKTESQLREDLKAVDIIFVAGGNVFYLLDKIHKSGFAKVAREHVERGKIYIGESSGSLVMSDNLAIAHREEALEKVPGMTDFTGMGIIDFIVFPHWGSAQNKDFYLSHRMVKAYEMGHKIILLTDRQYVFVKGDWIKILEAPPKPQQPVQSLL